MEGGEEIKEEIIKSLHDYYLNLKKANDRNIEMYNKKYKNNPDFRLWQDETGYSRRWKSDCQCRVQERRTEDYSLSGQHEH